MKIALLVSKPVHVELAEQDEAEEAAKKAEAEAEKAKAVTASPTQTRRNAFHRSSSLTCTETVADINVSLQVFLQLSSSGENRSDERIDALPRRGFRPRVHSDDQEDGSPNKHSTSAQDRVGLAALSADGGCRRGGEAEADESARGEKDASFLSVAIHLADRCHHQIQCEISLTLIQFLKVQPTRPETLPLPVAVKPKTETTPLSSSLPETKKDWDVSEAKNTPSTSSPTSAKSQDEMEAETERIK